MFLVIEYISFAAFAKHRTVHTNDVGGQFERIKKTKAIAAFEFEVLRESESNNVTKYHVTIST